MTWEETAIWKALQERCGLPEGLLAWTEQQMRPIEQVLRHGGTTALSFTLHDDGHAARVCERMVQIVPQSSFDALSCWELTLLLMSAYLHDIGMTPEVSRLHAIYDYLLTGDPVHWSTISGADQPELQRWIDDEWPDFESTKPQPRKAREFLGAFARDRHNDWSVSWIREHLHDAPAGYRDLVDDLALLCASHHHGFEALKSDTFNAKITGGSQAAPVRLRYLAAMLRVADVIEVDPERTPEVLIRHRDISDPQSLAHWHKDQATTVQVIDAGYVAVHSRPQTAADYSAVWLAADQIQAELTLCEALRDWGLLCQEPMSPVARLDWSLQSTVRRDIRERDARFVFIDGAFRPDTDRLLDLLGGTELYGNPLAAARELLQNAFDAVRESIARDRLNKRLFDAKWARQLGEQHKVELSMAAEGERWWLVCTDTGSGMDRVIIEKHLLVSGRSRRRDISELERRCRQHGFTTGRTAQFGVGVLSYFMLADRVEVDTVRDGERWWFGTDGVGSFGELQPRQIDGRGSGTTVRLRLRPELLARSANWFDDCVAYLREQLVRVPSVVWLGSQRVGPGWASSPEQHETHLVRLLQDHCKLPFLDEVVLDKERAADLESVHATIASLAADMASMVRWQTLNGDLSNGLGAWRCLVPTFELQGGTSLACITGMAPLDEATIEHIWRLRNHDGHMLATALRPAWKGIGVHNPETPFEPQMGLPRPPLGVVELDVVDCAAGSLSLARSEVAWSDLARSAVQEVHAAIIAGLQVRLAPTQGRYALLHWALLGGDRPQEPWFWSCRQGRRPVWREVEFPAAEAFTVASVEQHSVGVNLNWIALEGGRWLGRSVTGVEPILDLSQQHGVRTARLPSPTHLCRVSGTTLGLAMVWESFAVRPLEMIAGRYEPCAMPAIWPSLAYVESGRSDDRWHRWCLVNRAHPLVRQVSAAGQLDPPFDVWNPKEVGSPGRFSDWLREEPARLSYWLLTCFGLFAVRSRHLLDTFWRSLYEREADLLREALQTAVDGDIQRSELMALYCPNTLLRIRPADYEITMNPTMIFGTSLPEPGPDWTIFPVT